MSSLELPADLSSFNKKEFQDWLNSFDVVLFDCDGVIWMFYQILDEYKGSNLAVNRLQELGKKVYFVTNNPTRDRKTVSKIAKNIQFDIEAENIINTSFVVAEYLKKQNFNKTAYIIGPEGTSKELNLVGIKNYGVGPDEATNSYFFQDVENDPDVGAVIVGYDYQLSLPKLTRAATFLTNPHCQLIGLETEKVVPVAKCWMPLTGSIIKVLEESSNKTATIIGKPSDVLANVLFDLEGKIDRKRFLMVGDTLNTDIYFGKKYGMQTLLVSTGVNKLKDVEEVLEQHKTDESNTELSYLVPDFYIDKIANLFKNFVGKL